MSSPRPLSNIARKSKYKSRQSAANMPRKSEYMARKSMNIPPQTHKTMPESATESNASIMASTLSMHVPSEYFRFDRTKNEWRIKLHLLTTNKSRVFLCVNIVLIVTTIVSSTLVFEAFSLSAYFHELSGGPESTSNNPFFAVKKSGLDWCNDRSETHQRVPIHTDPPFPSEIPLKPCPSTTNLTSALATFWTMEFLVVLLVVANFIVTNPDSHCYPNAPKSYIRKWKVAIYIIGAVNAIFAGIHIYILVAIGDFLTMVGNTDFPCMNTEDLEDWKRLLVSRNNPNPFTGAYQPTTITFKSVSSCNAWMFAVGLFTASLCVIVLSLLALLLLALMLLFSKPELKAVQDAATPVIIPITAQTDTEAQVLSWERSNSAIVGKKAATAEEQDKE